MKKLFLLILGSLMLTACMSGGAIGDDPMTDGREMMYRSLSEMQKGDYSAADSIIGVYLDAYEGKELSDREQFILGASESHWYEMIGSPDPKWVEFLEKMKPVMQWYVSSPESISQLPNFARFIQMRIAIQDEPQPADRS